LSNASNDYGKRKKQSFLTDFNVYKIVNTAKSRENIKGFSYLASYDDIMKNDCNLNISRYVSSIEEDKRIDFIKVRIAREQLKQDFLELEKKISHCLIELRIGD